MIERMREKLRWQQRQQQLTISSLYQPLANPISIKAIAPHVFALISIDPVLPRLAASARLPIVHCSAHSCSLPNEETMREWNGVCNRLCTQVHLHPRTFDSSTRSTAVECPRSMYFSNFQRCQHF